MSDKKEIKIQIGVACGENCEYYVGFLTESIKKTISSNYNIEFIFGVSSVKVNVDLLKEQSSGFDYKIVYVIDQNNRSACSEGHGKTLNKILENMDSEYGMFIDCDCALLEKGWDKKLMDKIEGNIVIVGSEYQDGNKYMNFPNAVFCMFKTNVLKGEKVSFSPRGRIKVDKENCEIYEKPIGEEIHLDVGWELYFKLKKSGYEGIHLPLIRGKSHDSVFMKEDMRGEEYQLDGVPICTHVGRSSTRSFLNSPIVILWKERVQIWLNGN